MAEKQLDLVILTPTEFRNSLVPLSDHKNKTGITTEIHVLTDIYRQFQGRDEAEKVKRFLADAHTRFGLRFALLVGDSDKFPVRYTKTDRAEPKASNTAFYVGDLYYADLFRQDGSFDDWDRNGNGFYGELRGESGTGSLSVDDVDMRPDIAVGRLPASTNAEVERYVRKVIRYENGGYRPAWFKKALLVATTNWMKDACKTHEETAQNLPAGFTVHKLYSAGNPCAAVDVPTPARINQRINSGVGFVSYIGHGSRTEWQGCYGVGDLAALTNNDKLPVVFASACSTAEFATQPPYDGYTDIKGTKHKGTNNGEVFQKTPPQPACIQSDHNPESIGEHLTVKMDSGAIAYVGCATGAQPWSRDLNKFFFEGYRYGQEYLGGMWNFMIQKYYETHVLPAVISSPDWTKVAEYHQPWKFLLFGDPSLRIGGIRSSLSEDCIGVDPSTVRVENVNGRWKIVDRRSIICDMGRALSTALTAYRIVKHYGFTSLCFVGRPKPSMEYFLCNGKAPVGSFAGETAVGFNPSAIVVKKVGSRWKIVEGGHWIMDFASSEGEALKAVAIIQRYGFNHLCYVGSGSEMMQYFRR